MLKAILTRSFLAATAAMTVAGCASSSVDEPQPADEKQEMRFAVNDVSSRALATNSTLTTEGSTFDVWGQMVRTQPTGGTRIKVFDGVTVTRTATDWTYDNPQYWFPGFTYDFKAIYSAGEKITTNYGDDGSLTISNFDATKGVDLLFANETRVCPETATDGTTTPMGTVDLKFRHQLSRVTFGVRTDDRYTGGDNVRKIVVDAIEVTGVNGTATLNVAADGKTSWSIAADAPRVTYSNSPDGGMELSNDYQDLFPGDKVILAIPQTLNGVKVKVSYHYTTGSLGNVSTEINLNGTWEAGKSYRYPITINTHIFFGTPEVDEWTTAPISNNDFNIE